MSNDLLISTDVVLIGVGGTLWLNPFTTVLFNVCSAVLFCTRVAWVCLVYLQFCKE